MRLTQERLLVFDQRYDLASINESIARSKYVGEKLAVYHGIRETSVLRNMGVNAPSPIMTRYKWPGLYKPYDHQKQIAAFLTLNHRAFNFSEQGTGKTAAAAWAADFLLKEKYVKRVLIFCPLSIMDSAWRADLFKVLVHRRVDVMHGNATKCQAILDGDAEIIVTNFDSVKFRFDMLSQAGFDLIIIDEGTAFKNPSTDRWKCMSKLIHPETWVWLMTGTPAAQSPEDAFGLAKLLVPHNVPRAKSRFRDQVMYRVTQWKWIPKKEAPGIVSRVLQPAIRFLKEDCLDLPEMVYQTRAVEMSKQQAKYYDMMRNHMLMQADGEQVTGQNAAINLLKLLQIGSGSLRTDTGEILEFDITPRYKVLKEVMQESTGKTLIFAQFTSSIERIHAMLVQDGINAEIINGAVPVKRRTSIFRRFQQEASPEVLVIQPAAAAHGVTLTAADTVVWWTPTASLETYDQANARVHRAGQTRSTTVVRLQGSPVERHLNQMLIERQSVHSKLMEFYKKVLA